MDDVVDRLRAFIRRGPPHTATFALTTTAGGATSVRQAGTYVTDDFRIVTVTRASAVRVDHIERSRQLAYLWVDKTVEHPARTVMLSGDGTIDREQTAIEAHLAERQRLTGIAPAPEVLLDRVLSILEPRFLRAEGFLPGGQLVVIRHFDPITPQIVGFGLT